MTVDQLSFETRDFFLVKAEGEVGNLSETSNVSALAIQSHSAFH